MLLTLSAFSYRTKLGTNREGMSIFDLPQFVRAELGLAGIVVPTSYLAGWDEHKVDKLRDAADKAACPILMLHEDQPVALASSDESIAERAVMRIERVVRVAHRLGCSGVALTIDESGGAGGAGGVETAAARLKHIIGRVERLEMNLLVAPGSGATALPEQLTTLIRKVGGFRIGSFPDLLTASTMSDTKGYLRGLVPYANAISVSFNVLNGKKDSGEAALKEMVESIAAIGYEGNMMLEFRGAGEPEPSILAARDIIQSISQEPTE
ncbi:MAG TPA: TIM barrel protein [Phycisphaerales bacterium]|nr:TIM barrel protein [Phycisphaerales bacterium]